MAKNISTTFSVDLSGVVSNAITTVKAIRKSETARKEAEFQRAIANGLSYDDQITMRERQLIDEKESNLSDSDFIISLEKSIGDTKSLNRFNKYRTKYTTSFTDLVAGRINEQRYLDVLKDQLIGVNDSELRLEIQKNIASAEDGLKTYNDIILSNKVKLAKFDGSVKTIASMVSQVTIARTNALINDNQNDVTAYDETLASLNSQLSSIRIEDAMLDFQAKSVTKGTSALEKLDFMNEQILSADPNSIIRISDGSGGAKTYPSAQAFWSVTRDNYLSSSFFKELDINIKNNVVANTKAAGIPQVVLDDVMKTFNNLRAKPEIAPFIQQLEANQNTTMNTLVESFANRWITAAGITGDFTQSSQQIAAAGNRYAVDVTSYVENLAGKAASLVGQGAEEEVVKAQPPFKGEVIENVTSQGITGVPPVVSTTPTPKSNSIVDFLSSTGRPSDFNSRAVLAAEKGITNYTGTAEQNIQLLNTLQTETKTPVSAPVEPPVTPTPTPTSTSTSPTPVTPTPPVAPKPPVTPTTPTGYIGASIVDYLKSVNKDSSFASRAKLATEKGITNYTGVEKQNDELLKLLRG